MNRLTKRHNTCVSWNGNPDNSTQARYRELLDRLAEYEDTGLTPVEVAEMAKAKADGRCAVLPLKPGDKAWFVCVEHEPKEMEVEYVSIVVCADRRIVEVKAVGIITRYVFGKTVFLTRPEAEAALRKE
jgi:hypothetical protein